MTNSVDERTALLDTSIRIKPCRDRGVCFKITVEPLLAIILFTLVMYSMLSQQYIYHQTSQKYGLTNATKPASCELNNISNITKELQVKVSAESSTWILYLNMAGFIPSIFCTILIGSWGDIFGRKASLLCSFTGNFLMILVYLIVVKFQLNIAFLLIGRIVAGLTGDFTCILASCYAYLADISSPKERTFKVAVGEASCGFGGIFASCISGIWIVAQGFTSPLWLLLVLLLFSIAYIVLFLDEKQKLPYTNNGFIDKLCGLIKCRSVVAMWKFLRSDWIKTAKVLGIGLCFFLQLIVQAGTGNVIVIYELSYPLCWTSLLVGFGSAIRDSAYLFGIALVKVLSNRVSDFAFILMSALSTTLGLIMFGVANITWMMFAGHSLSILRTVGSTVLRSMLSRLVGKDEQGSGFAIIACFESVAILVASFTFNSVYSATVHHNRGAVFFLGSGLQVFFIGFARFVCAKTKHDMKEATTDKQLLNEHDTPREE